MKGLHRVRAHHVQLGCKRTPPSEFEISSAQFCIPKKKNSDVKSPAPGLLPAVDPLSDTSKSSSISYGAIFREAWIGWNLTRQFEDHPAAKAQEAASELEELGYGAIWFGEAAGREALTHAGLLLAATRRIVVATGIANIYARDPVAMASGQKTLAEAYPDRFVLGLGVSHAPLVEQLRGHQYEKPVPRMRAYLDAMDQAAYRSVPPPSKPVRVLAALRPKMLELAAQRADGAHPYNVNLEHTARARKILGAGRYLCPEQAVVLETDPAKARRIGREFLELYLKLPNYTNNLLWLGFDENDFRNGGSDRLIDAIIAWGDLTAIRNRIRQHHSAGADHVCVQVLTADPRALPLREWRELASAVL